MKYFTIFIFLFFGFKIIAQPKYEFRASWVATVVNIDWPSKTGLTSKEQQKEIIDILDLQQNLGMNAIILQVRPASDAFYQSNLEPWSKYLTGIPGQAPNPFYDPLTFWIKECHKRGLELHAWLNPYRVAQNADEPLAGNHIAFQHPDWILEYGNKLYFDPGIPEARDFVIQVVKDIVKRYDVDAIHFDDYFYPYPLAEEFPDTTSFKLNSSGFELEQKADWRRNNVDTTIKMLNDTIKATKPWVKFGISPFGVWRNIADDTRGSDTKAGATNYDQLYADIIKWQKNGWIDYSLPQLYWRIGHPLVDFELLANWWKNHTYNRAMYVGHGIYKMDKESPVPEWTGSEEILKQIKLLRTIPEITGSAFFSSKHFNRDLFGLQDSLKNSLYRKPAIVPAMPWIDNLPPKSVINVKKSGRKIKWETRQAKTEMDKASKFVVYLNRENEKIVINSAEHIWDIVTSTDLKLPKLNKKREKYEVRISVLDRLNNESMTSKAVVVKL